VKLGIVYHMPFWRAADGTLREIEGSFARYVDSLAPYFDEISLCVPVLSEPRGEGTPIRATNVTLAPLPQFDGPVQFYPQLPISCTAGCRRRRRSSRRSAPGSCIVFNSCSWSAICGRCSRRCRIED
jgi:hypothetical protein